MDILIIDPSIKYDRGGVLGMLTYPKPNTLDTIDQRHFSYYYLDGSEKSEYQWVS